MAFFQRVEPKDFIGLGACAVLFAVVFVLLFGVFCYLEYDSTRARYDRDPASPQQDAFGNRILGKQVQAETEPDFTLAVRPAAIGACLLAAVVYLSNWLPWLRRTLGRLLESLFS